MAFSPNARVRVTNQHSQYRDHYGTVLSAATGNNQVRLDGFAEGKSVLLLDNELQTSTQPCPITY